MWCQSFLTYRERELNRSGSRIEARFGRGGVGWDFGNMYQRQMYYEVESTVCSGDVSEGVGQILSGGVQYQIELNKEQRRCHNNVNR